MFDWFLLPQILDLAEMGNESEEMLCRLLFIILATGSYF